MLKMTAGKGLPPYAPLVFLLVFLAFPALAGPVQPNLLDPNDCNFNHTILNNPEYSLTAAYNIPVVVHVISDTSHNGDLTDQHLIDQIQVLNEDFQNLATDSTGIDTQIHFNLVRITRTVNDYWFAGSEEAENIYMAALGWDQARFLNIYTNAANGAEGRVNDPVVQAGYYRDGVTLAWDLVGGRDQVHETPTRNQGRTAVHYVGRYLGLLETYSEGCREGEDTPADSGDLIPDTPAQLAAVSDCPETPTDSCGEGADPIHNFMNSTPDECRTEFTTDQAYRMTCFLLNYRPGLYKPDYFGLPILNGPLMPLLNFP